MLQVPDLKVTQYDPLARFKQCFQDYSQLVTGPYHPDDDNTAGWYDEKCEQLLLLSAVES
jgi:hypothetical protein